MPELHINDIAKAIEGTVEWGKSGAGTSVRFSHFHFDTRLITDPNTLFFALKADNNDGHDYVNLLESHSGAGAVVNNNFNTSSVKVPLIRVEDTLKAAQLLARHVRNQHRNTTYVGVTGSAGKTTTKEFIYQLLAHKYCAYRSYKNWNNWIGMPFSILNMTGQEEAAVFELAMSYPGIGEIDLLADILRPNAAIILNVFPVHLEFLKTVDNAAKAKSEILNYLASDDIAFVNGDNEPLMNYLNSPSAPRGHIVRFGQTSPQNDIRLKDIIRVDDGTRFTIDFYGNQTQFHTPLINRVHIENLFAAITLVHHTGMKIPEIIEAIKTVAPLSNRGQIEKYGEFIIINETYNSNPEALKKTLQWISAEYKDHPSKIAVVGDMLELGDNEKQYHREVGKFFASLNYHRLITVGKRAVQIAEGAIESGFDAHCVQTFDQASEAGRFLAKSAQKGSVILFKASRGIQLENAIRELSHE